MNTQDRLKQIDAERLGLLDRIWLAQERITELNTQRENLIMSEDAGDVEN